ncbi:RCC1 domain-containing protein [Lujinxingia vulgaris]|nr:hypothetical protein [Lujinxingia vulgaris]
MFRARYIPLALAPILSLGAACQTDTVACQQDSDCFLNERCSAGFCEARPSVEPDAGNDAAVPDDLDAEDDTADALPQPPDLTTLCPPSQRPAESGDHTPNVVALAPTHACAIDVSGRLFCWGDNARGQLGDGTLDPQRVPTRVAPACYWNRIDIAGETTCAITIDDQLFCWGDNRFGQLGQGDFEDRPYPVLIPGEWSSVSVGPDRVCARDNAGDTWCWGNNGTRRNLLGAENLNPREPSPVKVIADFYAIDITLGNAHTCAVHREDRQLYCWGDNLQNQIGPELGSAGSATPFFTMRNFTWQHISAAGDHTCGVLLGNDDRNMYCWGDDAAPYGLVAPDSEEAPHYIGADGHFGWTIFTSTTHTCSIDFNIENQTYGGMMCWGENASGQAVPDTNALVVETPQSVSLPDSDVYFAAVTDGVSCALSGFPQQLRCWGSNEHGLLATGDTEPREGLVAISLEPR